MDKTSRAALRFTRLLAASKNNRDFTYYRVAYNMRDNGDREVEEMKRYLEEQGALFVKEVDPNLQVCEELLP